MTRAFSWTLLGLSASVVLRQLELPSNHDPLTGTLQMLPLVLGLFLTASVLTSKRISLRSVFGPRFALGTGMIVLALARNHLGLRYGHDLGAAIVAAGLFILLFWQAASGLRAQATGRKRGSRRYLAFFLTLLAVYLSVLPWANDQRPPNGDEPYYLLLTHSLAYDFDADLTNNYNDGDSLRFMHRRIEPQRGDPVGPNGEKFSRHNIALPVILAPAYRVLGRLGALAMMAVLTAALALWTLRLLDLSFPERAGASLMAAATAGLSPPLLLYSHQAWIEVPAALLIAVAIEGIRYLAIQPVPIRRLLQIAVPVLLLPLVKLRFLAFSGSLIGLALVRSPPRLRKTIFRGGIVLLGLTTVILLFNEAVFGQALKHHSWRSLTTYFTSVEDYLIGPFGLLLDGAFGLFSSGPIWMLVVAGAAIMFRQRRGQLIELALLGAPYFILLAPWPLWYGGWSPPFRYGIVFLPLLAFFLVPVFALRHRSAVRLLIVALGAATVGLSLLWLVVPGWTYNFGDGRTLLLDHLTRILEADVAGLFPSAIRPRAANVFWLIACSGLLLAAFRRPRTHKSSGIAALGVAGFLFVVASVPVLAHHLPKRVVEFEDPYVEKSGGTLWPDQWVRNRPAYQGSWALQAGDQAGLRIQPRGGALLLELEVRRVGPVQAVASLEVLAGQTRLAEISLPPTVLWSTLKLEPLDWPRDEDTLTFRLISSPRTLLYLDRARLNWLD